MAAATTLLAVLALAAAQALAAPATSELEEALRSPAAAEALVRGAMAGSGLGERDAGAESAAARHWRQQGEAMVAGPQHAIMPLSNWVAQVQMDDVRSWHRRLLALSGVASTTEARSAQRRLLSLPDAGGGDGDGLDPQAAHLLRVLEQAGRPARHHARKDSPPAAHNGERFEEVAARAETQAQQQEQQAQAQRVQQQQHTSSPKGNFQTRDTLPDYYYPTVDEETLNEYKSMEDAEKAEFAADTGTAEDDGSGSFLQLSGAAPIWPQRAPSRPARRESAARSAAAPARRGLRSGRKSRQAPRFAKTQELSGAAAAAFDAVAGGAALLGGTGAGAAGGDDTEPIYIIPNLPLKGPPPNSAAALESMAWAPP